MFGVQGAVRGPFWLGVGLERRECACEETGNALIKAGSLKSLKSKTWRIFNVIYRWTVFLVLTNF